MKKISVRLGLYRLTRTAKPGFGKNIVQKMTNNNNFPAAETATLLEDLDKASDDLQVANEKALSRATEDVSRANELEREFDTKATDAGLYVQGKANDNQPQAKSIIESAGMEVRKTPSPTPVPEAVQILEANFTNQLGKIMLKWKMPRHASQIFIYMTTTPEVEQSWVLVSSMQGRQLLVENLVSNTRYYFRSVVANRKNQKSGLSDIASTVAA
ncbi:MAG TPA: fibronectin type III domain-containing protein [Bacteroidia bacterium]|nr:fibronectin type III domain-containing protein [Bacteroidia bacterium]HNU34397.1 fibronectin type III domain-containing protein [Bacteroidia bacterium]